MLITFLYCAFDVHEISSDGPSFISGKYNFVFSLIFMVNLAGGLLILLIFSKKLLLVLLIFCIDFLFSVSLFSTLVLTVSFLWLALG